MAMTEQPAQDQAPPQAPPKLVHSGVYVLWETPDGGRLLAYKRLTTVDPGGAVVDIPEPKDEQLPHIPAEALPLVSQFLDNGIPPGIMNVLATLQGGGGRLAAMKSLASLAQGLAGEMAAAADVPAEDAPQDRADGFEVTDPDPPGTVVTGPSFDPGGPGYEAASDAP